MGFITLLKGSSQALEAKGVLQKQIQLVEGGMVLGSLDLVTPGVLSNLSHSVSPEQLPVQTQRHKDLHHH